MFEIEAAVALARRHVDEGSCLVHEQTSLLAKMEPGSEQAATGADLLRSLRATQEIFVSDLERLETKAKGARP